MASLLGKEVQLVKHGKRLVLVALLVVGLALDMFPVATAALPASTSASVSSQTGGSWTNFSTADGLASDSIFALDISSNGYLWVGTSLGASVRAPTGEWLILTDSVGENTVTDIAPDPTNSQQRWFATYGGAVLLSDGGNPLSQQGHTWSTFTKSDGLAENYVSAVAVGADGQIWLGTNFFNTTDGTETGYGVSVLNMNGTPFSKGNDTWFTYTTSNSSLPNNVIRDIVVDSAGTVWIATKGGLAAFSNNVWTTYYTWDGLPSNNITDLLVVGNLLWIGTKGGIAVLDYKGTPTLKGNDQWMTYTQYNSGLVDNDTSSLSVDGAGRLWIGTTQISGRSEVGSGVSVLDTKGTPFNRSNDQWRSFTTSNDLADNAVRAVLASGTSSVWFGTRQGLSFLNYGDSPFATGDDSWTTYKTSQRLANNTVNAVAEAGSQSVWLGTDQGLNLLQYTTIPPNKQTSTWITFTSTDGLVADGIRALAMDSQGRVWIGTAAGLTVRDTRGTLSNKQDDVSISYTTSNSPLVSDQINDIVIDSAGRAWIACGNYGEGGLQVLSVGTSLSSRGDDAWATFTPSNSNLPHVFVRAIALQGSNTIWTGTFDGAARLNYGSSPFDKGDDTWTVYNTSNSGLGENNVRDVALDTAGNVWFGLTSQGVSVLTTSDSWINFSQTDGLASNSVNTLAIDSTGKPWIGTDGNGVSVLDHKGTLANKSDYVWTTYAGGTPLLSGNILAITFDRWGQTWLGTLGGGASVYSTVQVRQIYLPLVMR